MKNEVKAFLETTDDVMKRLIANFGSIDLKPKAVPPLQSLIHAIAHQQLTGKAANTILGRFTALFGNGTFPTAEQILEMDSGRICSAGFSRAKAAFIRGVAEKQLGGFIPTLRHCEKLTDAEIVERLTRIKGVGRWTAEMFLIFNLGRPDVLPIHDFGVRKGFQIAYGKRKLPEPEQLERFGRRWSPYRTTAAIYLYRAADFLKDGEW